MSRRMVIVVASGRCDGASEMEMLTGRGGEGVILNKRLGVKLLSGSRNFG